MRLTFLPVILIFTIFSSCTATKPKQAPFNTDIYLRGIIVRYDTLTLIDSARKRIIPITIYNRDNFDNRNNMLPKNIKKKLVILNPGYGGTRNDYSYIATNLAGKDYLVVTIQHDLPTDDSLPRTGDIYKLRKPFWDRGVQNVFFVTAKLKKEYPKLDYNHIILVGHSNGGDIAMLLANEYPKFAKAIITLDNLHVPIPRSNHPRILSIRSGDQPADDNVLPSTEEMDKFDIKIVKVNTTHHDMGNMGTDAQKKEINDYITEFLENDL